MTSQEVEARLIAWGVISRRTSDRLGYPASSGIARMIEQVKVFPKKRSTLKPKTANGKQTRSMRPQNVAVSSSVMEVDAVIAKLPGWMSATIHRSYLWNQPDRLAARQLKMPRHIYTQRREAAVIYIGERLAEREGHNYTLKAQRCALETA